MAARKQHAEKQFSPAASAGFYTLSETKFLYLKHNIDKIIQKEYDEVNHKLVTILKKQKDSAYTNDFTNSSFTPPCFN